MKSFLANRKHSSLLVALILAGGLFFWLSPAHAGVGEYMTQGLAAIVSSFIWLLGRLLTVIIFILMWIAQYNSFINSPAVAAGWEIIRDICNMFFVLILLVIAFQTTINRGDFKMTSALPKLILAAIFINFSKLICGAIIDVAQVVMLTFVNGFRDIGAGNFASLFSLSELLAIDPSGSADGVTLLSVLGSYLLALIYIIIAIIVVSVMVFMLIMRMVMLWILIVLSPLPWLLGVAPQTKPYAKRWWDMFLNNVVSGPLLAFFIWLSFAAISVGSTADDVLSGTKSPAAGENEATYLESIPDVGLSKVGKPDTMLKFLISIGLLMGGLMITKELSGAVGSMAGKGLGAVNKLGGWAKKQGIGMAKNTGQAAASTGLKGTGALAGGLGRLSSKATGGKLGGSLSASGKFLKSWGGDISHTRQHHKEEARKKTLEKLGMKDETMDKLKEAAKTPLGRSVKGATALGLGAVTGNPFIMAAGVAHLAAVHQKDMAGGMLKGFASLYQRGINYKNSMDDTFQAKRNMSQPYHERQRSLEELDENKSKEIVDVEKAKRKELKAAEGKPQAELDRIEAAYANKYKSITDKYKNLAAAADATYSRTATDVQKANDTEHEGAYFAAQDKEEKAHADLFSAGSRRRSGISRAKGEYKRDVKSLNSLKQEELKAASEKYSGESLRIEHGRINARYQKEQESLKKERDAKINAANAAHSSRVDVPMTNMITRGIKKAGVKVSDWETNDLTIKAAALGSKKIKTARQTVANIIDEGFEGTSPSELATKSGINDDHEYFYKELGHSAPGMKAVIAYVRNLKENGFGKNEKEIDKNKKVMNNLKKGIAYFNDKTHGHHEGEYATLISELNGLDTGHKNVTVSDWGPKGGHGHGGHGGGHDDHSGHGHDEHGGGGSHGHSSSAGFNWSPSGDDHDDHGGGHH